MKLTLIILYLLLLCGCNAQYRAIPCPRHQKPLLKKQQHRKPLPPTRQAPVWLY